MAKGNRATPGLAIKISLYWKENKKCRRCSRAGMNFSYPVFTYFWYPGDPWIVLCFQSHYI